MYLSCVPTIYKCWEPENYNKINNYFINYCSKPIASTNNNNNNKSYNNKSYNNKSYNNKSFNNKSFNNSN